MTSSTKTQTPATTTPTLTGPEKKELETLERRFARGQRESIAALKEIREKKLYRAKYKTFDAYMAGRWNRTRQWATQMISWARRQELLESMDTEFAKSIYQLTLAEATALAPLEPSKDSDDADLYAKLYMEAVKDAQEEADKAKSKRTTKMMKKAVQRKKRFLENRDDNDKDLSRDEGETSDTNAQSADETDTDGLPLDEVLYEVEPSGDLAGLMNSKTACVTLTELLEVFQRVQALLEQGKLTNGGVRYQLKQKTDSDQ